MAWWHYNRLGTRFAGWPVGALAMIVNVSLIIENERARYRVCPIGTFGRRQRFSRFRPDILESKVPRCEVLVGLWIHCAVVESDHVTEPG